MSAPAWLVEAIVRSDDEGLAVEQVADVVLDALPKEVIAAAIMSAAHAVLKQRGISDGGHALSQEIANNAAATVMLMLAVDP